MCNNDYEVNRMKKTYISLIIASILCLAGCNKNNNVNTSGNSKITKTSGFTIEQDNYEAQPYWASWQNNLCKTDGGYYIYSNSFLYYYITDSNIAMPLCNKSDCTHDSRDCNAYLGQEYSYTLAEYDHQLFMLRHNDSDVMLVKYETDGSGNYTELFKVGEYSAQNDDFFSWNIVFNNDKCYVYNYYPYNAESKPVITEYSLDGKNAKKTISLDGISGDNLTLASVKSYGNKIFYSFQTMIPDLDTKFRPADEYTGIFVYDTEQGTTMQLFKNQNIRDFAVNEENNTIYYFVTGEGLKMSSLDNPNSKAETIYPSTTNIDCCLLSYDGEHLYLDNVFWANLIGGEKSLIVFDKTGKQLNSINLDSFPENPTPLYGDNQNLFFANGSIVIDKSNIETITSSELIKIAEQSAAK